MQKLLVSGLSALGFVMLAQGAFAAAPAYKCVGFEDPLTHSPVHASRGRVLPFRAELHDGSGKNLDATTIKASPMIQVTFLAHGGKEVDKSALAKPRDFGVGRSFVFDQEHGHWKFDLQTEFFPEDGNYRVTIVPGDASYQIDPRCKVDFMLHKGDD